MRGAKTNLLGMTREELSAFAEEIGERPYRGGQLFTWLYAKGATSFDAMTDLGKEFRRRLDERAVLEGVTTAAQRRSASDGTVKILFALGDGAQIESVLIPPASAFRDGGTSDDEQRRLTLCVSTQVGCPLDCAFCATGAMGFLRNLTAGEIVAQVLEAKRMVRKRITNVVFMGMGEPLLNYDAVMTAADIIVAGAGIGAKRVTISTAGRADRIRRMGDEHRRVKLALSLHSAVEKTRASLMPITKNFGLAALGEAIEHYYKKTRARITYEVIFFDGINDSDHEVDRLIAFARRVPCKVNVIPFHAIGFVHPSGIAATLRPSPRIEENVERLRNAHLTVMVRSSAGEDIAAACGQLAVISGHGAAHRRLRAPSGEGAA